MHSCSNTPQKNNIYLCHVISILIFSFLRMLLNLKCSSPYTKLISQPPKSPHSQLETWIEFGWLLLVAPHEEVRFGPQESNGFYLIHSWIFTEHLLGTSHVHRCWHMELNEIRIISWLLGPKWVVEKDSCGKTCFESAFWKFSQSCTHAKRNQSYFSIKHSRWLLRKFQIWNLFLTRYPLGVHY